MSGYAWVTLTTNDSYSLGALVLAHSLKKSNTAHKLAVLITPAVSQPMREHLQTVFDVVKVVDVLDSKDEAHLALMKRPDLGITFTKIHCWRLVEFEKCVFLDADTLVVRNCDELFEREEFSAAPDVSWPDCFNSGVFVYRPSVDTFNKLLSFAVENRSFDGGDQGLLNQFFSDWATEDIKKHLPFVYNLTSVAAYSYIPAFKHYGAETRIVHFIGTGKPWLQQLDAATKTVTPTFGSEHLTPLLQQWWDLFCEKVHPNLDKNLESNNDGMSHPPVEACSNSLPVALTDENQMPRLIEPCTPYREKDDFRQSNLPYQPFNVKGSCGELLNMEFLRASVAPPVSSDEQQRLEVNEREEKIETAGKDISEMERVVQEVNTYFPQVYQKNLSVDEPEEPKDEEIVMVEQIQQQEEQPPKNPFDYTSFFPDETCISNYLEQNVVAYQLFNIQKTNETKEPEQNIPSLPRFLTIPENDRRQSGNTETISPIPEKTSELLPFMPSTKEKFPSENNDQHPKEPTPERVLEKRELTKSKSLPYISSDVTTPEPSTSRSIWKSQPDVNVDLNRKYSMPKLKPILPKHNSFNKSVPSAMPKVTLYTEFFMSSDYKDPIDLPKDKVGFVEAHIRKQAKLRRTKSDADMRTKFGPLPYVSSPELEKPSVPKRIPFRQLHNELYDLTQCKRQMGNKPKPGDEDRNKNNVPLLPAMKPIVPAKEKKSTLLKRRKSIELSPGEKEREKISKREPKEQNRELKTARKNVPMNVSGRNLDEILKKLREFSKDYQHFFGTVTGFRKKTVKCRNATVQDGECGTSDVFESVRTDVSTRTKETQTRRRESSEFRQFRNYVRDQRETTQKGLLSIQDLLSVSAGSSESSNKLEKENSKTHLLFNETVDGNDSNTKKYSSEETSTNIFMKSKVANLEGREEKICGSDESDDILNSNTNYNKLDDRVQVLSSKSQNKVLELKRTLQKESVCLNSRESKTFVELELLEKAVEEDTEAQICKDAPEINRGLGKKTNCFILETTGNCRSQEKLRSVVSDSESETENREKHFSLNEEAVENAKESAVEDVRVRENDFKRTKISENVSQNLESKPRKNIQTCTKDATTVESSKEPPEQDRPIEKNAKEHGDLKLAIFSKKTHGSDTCVNKEGKKPLVTLARKVNNDGMTMKMLENAVTAEEASQEPKGQKNGVDAVAEQKRKELLCVPDFETPRSSRTTLLPPPKTAAFASFANKGLVGEFKTPGTTLSTPETCQKNELSNDSSEGTVRFVGKKSWKTQCEPENVENVEKRSGIAGAIAQLNLESGSQQSPDSTAASITHQEYLRRQNWETGNVDYMGKDSFDNIWSKICQTIEAKALKAETGGAGVLEQTTKTTATAKEDESPTKSLSLFTMIQKCPDYIETLSETSVVAPLQDDEIIFSKCENKQLPSTNVSEGAEGGANGGVGKFKLSDVLQSIAPVGIGEAITTEEIKPESRTVAPAATSLQSSSFATVIKPRLMTLAADDKPQTTTETPEIKSRTSVEVLTEIKQSVPQQSLVALDLPTASGELKTQPSTITAEMKVDEATPQPPTALEVKPGLLTPSVGVISQSVTAPAEVKTPEVNVQPPTPSETKSEFPASPSEVISQSVATPEAMPKLPVASSDLESQPGAPGSKPVKEVQSSSEKPECKTVAICQPQFNFLQPYINEQILQTAEECKIVPMTTPPIFPAGEQEANKKPEMRSESIPLPPPESTATAKINGREEGKQKKGVFTKILEIVGVSPKEKNESEISKSVFYDASQSKSDKVEKTVEEGKEALESGGQQKREAAESEFEKEGVGDGDVKTTARVEKKKQQENTSKSIPKPMQNSDPKEPKTPSPKLRMFQTPPVTAIATPTPPPHPDIPPRKNSALLKVEDTVLETPPVPEPPTEIQVKLSSKIDEIIGKAKVEVENLIQDRRSAEKETGETGDFLNAMKLMMGQTDEIEELRVTTEAERKKHKGEVVSSKLSDQILKAIPPPRRKAISEASSIGASTSAIPKPGGSSGEGKAKPGKASSIPVPPPRNKGKPTPPPPQPPKSKGKK